MKYNFLTDDQRLNIRNNTLAQIESEHFANELAAERARAAGQDDAAFIEQMESLEKQHEALVV